MWVQRVILAVATMLVLSGAALVAQGDRSLCADCHFANTDGADRRHIDAWSLSKHGQAQVGCERCHGGDPTTTERTLAHRGVLRSSVADSRVHRTNLPATCGTCHAGPFSHFQQSRHFALLKDDDRRGPTCTTCHDSVAAQLASPRRLEQTCQQCHGPNGREPREGRPASARLMLENISEVRESIRAADRLIARVADPTRLAGLTAARQQAEVPLTQARDAGHRFVFDELQLRLNEARDRTMVLMQLLIEPR